MLLVPAEPRTPPDDEQGVSGSNCALTLIGTVLSMFAAQIVAAKLNRLSRWAPNVVPLLPPSGVAGVASLNPSPGPSLLMILMTVELLVRSDADEIALPVTELSVDGPVFEPVTRRGAALRIISLY